MAAVEAVACEFFHSYEDLLSLRLRDLLRLAALDELIGELRWTLYEISEVLTASYLSHLTASRLTVSW